MTNDNQHIPTGYKPSPLGIIPEDWEVKRLGEVCDIDKNSLSSNTNPDYEFDYISLSDVDSESFETTTTRQVFKSAPSRARRIVSKGDVIISTVRPNLQAFMLIKDEVKDLIVSTGFAVLTPQKINGEYLYQYVFSQSITKQFYQLVVGSNYPAVNSSDVFHLKIAVPPIPEQQRIVSVLSLWDTAIAKQTALIEQLTLRKRGLMQQLLTGKKRLKGFEGEWKKVRLGEMLHTLSNGMIYDTTTTDGFKITRIETISDGTININKVGYCEFEPANEFKLQKGDILYSHINSLSHIGKVAYYDLDETIYHGMNLLLLRTNELINNKYLYYLLLSSVSKHQALRYAKPAINQASISTSDIKKFKYKIPHIDEQNAIISVLVNADKEIEIQKQKLAAMQEQKKGLMQVLLTGKKRIKL